MSARATSEGSRKRSPGDRSARGRGARGVYRGESASIGTTAALILKNTPMGGAITWAWESGGVTVAACQVPDC